MNALALAGAGASVQCDWIDTKKGESMKVWLKAGVIIFYVLGYCFLRKRMRRDISQLSKENPNMVFTSIGHLINKEMLKKCHETMQKDKATGIDGITKEEYGKHLEENLEKLVERLKNRSYKPIECRGLTL